MATLATLKVDLIANSAVFRTEMLRAQQSATQSLTQIQKQSQATADAISAIGKAAAGFVGFQAFKDGIGALIDTQVKLQQIQFTLQAATGSAASAANAMSFIHDEAEKLGLSFQPTAQGFARLSASASALGVPMSQQKALFDAYAKSATTLHLSVDDSTRALLALEQMMSKGKIQAQELRLQLGQAIPGAAERSQLAIMKMVQGTDLAGKSFDTLLKEGDLYTAQFLPAIIQALRESAGGEAAVERASHSLNAELGRLNTAWFDFKTNISSGLFNEAAISSIHFVAENLGKMVSVLELGAAFAVARGVTSAGSFIGQKAGGAISAAQSNTANAAANAAQAESVNASNAALVRNLQLKREQIQSAKLAAQAEVEARQQAIFQAQAENEAAQATLAHTRTAAVLSSNLAAQRDAEAAAAVAAGNLARQEQLAAGALERYTLTTALAAKNSEQLAIAQDMQAASAARASIANKEAAAAQAAGGLLGMAKRGAAGIGSGALALVGGVPGIVIASLIVLGTTLLSDHERAVKFKEAMDDASDTLKTQKGNIDLLVRSYNDLDASFQSTNVLKAYQEALEAASQAQSDLAKAQNASQTAQAQSNYDQARANANKLAAVVVDQMRGTLQPEALARYQQLAANAQDASGQLKAMILTVAELNHTSADQFFANFNANISAFQKFVGGMQDSIEDLKTKLSTFGMSKGDAIRQQLANFQQTDQFKGLTRDQQLLAISQAQADAALQDTLDKRKAEAKAAAKAASEAITAARQRAQAADQLYVSLQRTNAELSVEAGLTQKLGPAAKELLDIQNGTNKAYNDATDALKKKILAEAQDNAQLEAKAAANKKAAESAQWLATLEQRNADIKGDLQRQYSNQLAGVGMGQKEQQQLREQQAFYEQYGRSVQDAMKEHAKGRLSDTDFEQAKKDAQDTLDFQLQANNQFHQQLNADNADWANGLHAAMQDYIDQADNMAQHARDFVNSFANGFSDAFVQFATGAESAKKAFGDFIDQMYADALRFLANQAISRLFKSLMPGGGNNSMTDAFGNYSQSATDSTAGSIVGDILGDSGSSGGSSGGGFWSGLFSAAASYFGGGRANGGPVQAGMLYRVNENGPELLTFRNRTFLMTGAESGNVTPMRQSNGAGSSTVINVAVQPTSTRRTAQQVATEVARKQRIATARNG